MVGGGTAFVFIFGIVLLILNSHSSYLPSQMETNKSSTITTIIIPEGTIVANSTNYEPKMVRVIIGINNTVKWINESNESNGVWPDDNTTDPQFAATTDSNFILPGDSFEFTFTKSGIINYHGKEWLSGTVIILSNTTSVSNRSQITYYTQPKIMSHNSYDGIERSDGVVILNNRTYYQMTLNYTVDTLVQGKSIEFHNVIFSFPYGIGNTPGGSIMIPHIKFRDGSEEIYGKNVRFPNGSGYGIGVPVPSGPISSSVKIVTVLSNHIHPQAGITLYGNEIKLLVSIS